MNADPTEPGRAVAQTDDDLSIVPGLGPVPPPRTEHAAPTVPAGRLDPALDPDRFDPALDAAAAPGVPVGPLDPAQDPDRYDPRQDAPPGQGQTLVELLGEGAFEDERNGWEWAFGLAGVVLFLALVSWFFTSVVSP